MLRLFIFAIVMLALSGICNGQGVTLYGASRSQDTSKTKGQQVWTAYSGSADTTILIVLPNGNVKKVSKTAFAGGAQTLQQVLAMGDTTNKSIYLYDTAKIVIDLNSTATPAIYLKDGMNTAIDFESKTGRIFEIGSGGTAGLQSKFYIYDVNNDLSPFIINNSGVHIGGFADTTPVLSAESVFGFSPVVTAWGKLKIPNTTIRTDLSDSTVVMRNGDTVCIAPPIQPLLNNKLNISDSSIYATQYDLTQSIIDTSWLSKRITWKPKVYNVDSFGASGLDTEDDVAAIQNAILACAGYEHISFNLATGVDSVRQIRDSMNGGTVWFPNGEYYAKRRLVKSVVHLMLNGEVATLDVNAQIYLPYSPVLDTNDINPLTIELEGETAPNLSFETPTRQVFPHNWDNGTRIRSTISNDASIFPSVISSVKGDNVLGVTFPNNVFCKAKSMWVTPAYNSATGTQLGGIDFQYAIDSWVESCRADPDTSGAVTRKPTNDVCGIRLTNTGYGVVNGARNSFSSGFTFGFIIGEHAVMDNTQSMINWSGYEILPSFHPIEIRDINAHWCKYAITTGYISQPFGSQVAIIKGTMRNEIYCPAGFWTTYVYNIKDSTNILRGSIDFVTRNLGSGCTPPQGTLAVQGADSLETRRIDMSDWRLKNLPKSTAETGLQVIMADTTQQNRMYYTNAIRVNAGKVGIGTAAPTVNFEMYGVDNNAMCVGRRESSDVSGFAFQGRKSRAGLTAVQTDDVLAIFSGTGMMNNSAFASGSKASFAMRVGSAWTTSNNETYLSLSVTPASSTTLTEGARLSSAGNWLVGTTTDIPSSRLTIASTTQGFLPPRMTATQGSAISSPAEGLIIYVTNTNGTFTAKGWWGWDGAAWQKLNN